jgi:predicted transcriptional regulator
MFPARILVYSSGEQRAIIGWFEVAEMIRAPFEELLELTGCAEDNEARKWLREYYGDLELCGAIRVGRTRLFPNPLPIDELRRQIPDFMPPQSFTYVRDGALAHLARQ